MSNQICYIKTPIGVAKIEGDERGIQAISVLDEDTPFGHPSDDLSDCLVDAKQQLQEYFSGERFVFNLTLNPQGTPFQQQVWKALMEIPFGKTTTYLEQSKKLGDPKAIRAVASAQGKNPLWIVVPCHRVIGSDGSLTGYAGGLWRKQWLLNHENPSPQQSLF